MMMATPAFKMFGLTMILAGLTVLVAAANEVNGTSTASPKVQKMSTTVRPKTNTTTVEVQRDPPFAAVMDLFQAPLAAFKPKMVPAKHPDDKTYEQLGRTDGNPSSTPAGPMNIFVRAGSNLGSAASSLTGWFNNRMIPQALRPASSTTPAPQVIHIITNPNNNRRVMASPEKRKKSQNNHQPLLVLEDFDDFDDIEENVNDDDENDSIVGESDNFNWNQNMNEDDDEEEDNQAQVEHQRNGVRQNQKRPNGQYYYIEEEMGQDDYFDYEEQMPARRPQRKQQQQQQNFPNNRRKNQKPQQQKKRKPMKKVQNPQRVQIVQNRPMQVNRNRRPAASFELVPISLNQAMNSIPTKKKPNPPAQQRPLAQFFNIPWSRLGLSGPPKETASNEQQPKPIIIQIPSQQQVKRKRRPNPKPVKPMKKNPQRIPVRGQFENQKPVFAMLNEQQIREILNNQANQQAPKKTSPEITNVPVTLNKKRKPVKKESEDMPPDNSNNNEDDDNNDEFEAEEKPQAESDGQKDAKENSYIYVGPANDETEIGLDLYRHHNSQQDFLRGRSSPRHKYSWEEDLDDNDDDDYDEE